MEIEYELTEADVVALTRCQLQRTPRRRNPIVVRRLAYLSGFTLMAVGLHLLMHNAVATVSLLILAILAFLFYPVYFDWLIRRRVSRTYRDPQRRAGLASRTLRATGEGLEEASGVGAVSLKWPAISELVETPTHAIIFVQGLAALVVPKARVRVGDYAAFVSACRAYMRAGAG